MKTFKTDFLIPAIVVTAICFVITAIIAVTNSFTSEKILADAEIRENQARVDVMPGADSFELLTVENLPESVTEIYEATNGAGYVFTLEFTGYGGKMTVLCGIDGDGRITENKTLSHSETKGLGSRTADDAYRDQYRGKTDSLENISSISGATISSKAYKAAIGDAFVAFNLIKEAN